MILLVFAVQGNSQLPSRARLLTMKHNIKSSRSSQPTQKTQNHAIWNNASAHSLANKYVLYIRETHCLIWSAQQMGNAKHVLEQED